MRGWKNAAFAALMLVMLPAGAPAGEPVPDAPELRFLSRTAGRWYFSASEKSRFAEGDTIRISAGAGDGVLGIVQAASSEYIAADFPGSPGVAFSEGTRYSVRIIGGGAEKARGGPAPLRISPSGAPAERALRPANEYYSPPPRRAPSTAPQGRAGRNRNQQFHGSIALQYYSSDDLGRDSFDFRQPSAVMKFNGRNLAGTDWEMRVHMRSRADRRRQFGRDNVKSEYFHRIYEASLAYGGPDSRIGFGLGRLFASHLVSVGYLDGMIASFRPMRWFEIGGFGGTQPDIDRGDFKTDVVKAGGYVRFISGDRLSPRYEGTVAATRQTREGELDREFLYLQNRVRITRRISLYQSGELNLRRNKGGFGENDEGAVDLANAYASLQFEASEDVRFGMQYDARKNYRTLLNRTIPDSLFDEHLRQGGSLRVSWRPGRWTRLHGSLGSRGRAGGGTATSYSAGLSRTNIFGTTMRASLGLSGFSSPSARGFNPSAGLGRRFLGFWDVGLEAGLYHYNVSGWSSRRTRWLRLRQSWDILGRWSLSAETEYNDGSDVRSLQTFLSTGIRF